MKIKLLVGFVSLALSVTTLAETNWDQLIKDADFANSKDGVILKDFQELKVIELPGGKLRFDGFSSLIDKNRMKLIVETDRSLKETCYDYVELGARHKFKARLIFNISPIEKDFSFMMDGKIRSSRDFENNLIFGKTEVKELNSTDITPWMDRSLESLNVNVRQQYFELMNSAINNSYGPQVVVDLSKFNGLACDIGMGYIKPTLVKVISYDRALPESVSWLNENSFADLYKSFNEELEKAKLSAGDDQKFNESFILGWSIAQVDSNLKESVFKKADRGQKLLKTLKIKTSDGQSNTALWRQMSEYVRPEKTVTTQRMPIAVGAVAVELKD